MIWNDVSMNTKNNLVEGFTSRYNVHKLVYYEEVDDIQTALQREKQFKRWTRKWKIELIEKKILTGMIWPMTGFPLNKNEEKNGLPGQGRAMTKNNAYCNNSPSVIPLRMTRRPQPVTYLIP